MPQAWTMGEATGWTAAALAATGIVLAYLLRRGGQPGSLERLRPHYWIGFAVAGLSVLHGWVAMGSTAPDLPGWTAGVWIAMGAALLVFGQVSIGLRLRNLTGTERHRQRRLHFWTMTVLAAAALAHVALNGGIVRPLIGI